MADFMIGLGRPFLSKRTILYVLRTGRKAESQS